MAAPWLRRRAGSARTGAVLRVPGHARQREPSSHADGGRATPTPVLILDKALALNRIVARAVEPRLPEAFALTGVWRERSPGSDRGARPRLQTTARRGSDAPAESTAERAALAA